MLVKYLIVFLISMIPLIELRGAIPVGVGMNLEPWLLYVVAVLGNMIPVPFIYLFARKTLIWGKDKPIIGKFFTFCLEKGEKGGKKLEAKAGKGLTVALLLFVGIPLPGTGAWTGTLAGSILNMKFKDVVDNLNVLKLDKIAESLSDYVDKINSEKIPFLDALYELTKLEIVNKAERSSQFNIRIAHFPYYRTFDDFDFSFQPSINQEQVMELASLRFIEEKKNILLIGSPGTRQNSYCYCYWY